MKADKTDTMFDALRELPVEVSVEQVGGMIATFTLQPPSSAWLCYINLNSVLMTTAAAAMIAGSVYVFSPQIAQRNVVEPTIPQTVAKEQIMPVLKVDEAAAIPLVLEKPVPKPLAIVRTTEEEEPAPVTAAKELVLACVPAPSVASPEPEAATPTSPGNVTLEFPLAAYSGVAPMFSTGKDFGLSGFTKVNVIGAMDVVIEQADFSVMAEGDANAIEKLDITLKDGTLMIANKRDKDGKVECGGGSVTVHVRMPVLEGLALTGSGDVLLNDFNGNGEMDLGLEGSGDMHFARLKGLTTLSLAISGSGDIVGDDVQVSGKTKIAVAGSGDMRVAGRTDVLEVEIAGSGDVEAGELETRDCSIRVVGSGSVNANCKNMNARTLGSGAVNNTGDAGGGSN